jgi:hypothetical protein
MGSLYYLANDPRVPAKIRERFSQYGLCKDEFEEYGHIPYVAYFYLRDEACSTAQLPYLGIDALIDTLVDADALLARGGAFSR